VASGSLVAARVTARSRLPKLLAGAGVPRAAVGPGLLNRISPNVRFGEARATWTGYCAKLGGYLSVGGGARKMEPRPRTKTALDKPVAHLMHTSVLSVF
jgi:hypothetical protein